MGAGLGLGGVDRKTAVAEALWFCPIAHDKRPYDVREPYAKPLQKPISLVS
jgi:hypothetical protein